MSINLGGWSWAIDMALDYGAPALGAALGVPGPVSSFAVGALKRALGLSSSATPAETQEAATADPEVAKAAFQSAQSEVTAKYQYLTRLAEVQADVAKANTTEINATIRAETANGMISWWHWRNTIGHLVVLYGLEQVALVATAAFFPSTISPTDAAALFNATTVFTAGLFALLGYVASDTTNLKQTAITGERAPTLLNTAKAAVLPKKSNR